jgi:diguanylate cyclase (GGDEF)-like protein
MSESTPEGPHQGTVLLLGGAAVALVAAFLGLGPDALARRPALVWGLMLLPALVFTASARLLMASVALALGVVGAGMLEMVQPFSPDLRWWIAGGTSTLLVAVAALAFRREQTPERRTEEGGEGGPEVEAAPPGSLFHRPLVDLFLHKQIAAARRGDDLTVVFLRLDDFEGFRSRHGEGTAQQLLARTERSLRSAVRDSDVVGRYGEADFLTLLLGEDKRGAYMFANRIQRKVSRLALETDDGSIINSGVTISAGLATFHDGIETPGDLVAEAQAAVNGAQEQGGNRILVARDGSGE